jgi:hypothetical protein
VNCNVAFQEMNGLVQLLRQRNAYYQLIVFPDDVHESLLHTGGSTRSAA